MEENKEPYPCQEAVEMIEAMNPQTCRSLLVALVLEKKLGKSELECLLASSDDLLPAAMRKSFNAVDVNSLGEQSLLEIVGSILSTTSTDTLGKWLIERFGSEKDMITINYVATLYLPGCVLVNVKGAEVRKLAKIKFFFFLSALEDTDKALSSFRLKKDAPEKISESLLKSLPELFHGKKTANQAEVFFKNLTAHQESGLELLGDVPPLTKKRKSPSKKETTLLEKIEEDDMEVEAKEVKEVKAVTKKSDTLDDLVDFVQASITDAHKQKFPSNAALVVMMGIHSKDIARLDSSQKGTIQGMRNVLTTYAMRETNAEDWLKAMLTALEGADSLSFLHEKTADEFTVNQLCDKLMENSVIKDRVQLDFKTLIKPQKDETDKPRHKRQKKTKAGVKEETIEIEDDDESTNLTLSPEEDSQES